MGGGLGLGLEPRPERRIRGKGAVEIKKSLSCSNASHYSAELKTIEFVFALWEIFFLPLREKGEVKS